MRPLPVSLLALLLAAPASAGDGELGVPVDQDLRVRGRIQDVAALDLDGDSLSDLLVLSVSGQGASTRRWISLFWHGPGGRFARHPDVTWEPPPSVTVLDPFAPPEGAAPLWSLRADGLYRERFQRGSAEVTSERVLELELPHLLPADDSIAWLDVVDPWKEGRPDLYVPAFPRPRLFRYRDGAYDRGVSLELPPMSSYSASRDGAIDATYHFPMPVPLRDASGTRKLVVFRDGEVLVFDAWNAPEGAQLAAEPRSSVKILTEEEAAGGRSTVRSRLEDLDGDGRPDLVATVFQDTGMLRYAGRIMVYRGRPDGTLPESPDQTIYLEDAIYSLTRPRDLDGDGRLEIVTPVARLGVWAYIRVLTTRKVAFHLQTLEPDEEGRYDATRFSLDAFTLRLSKSFELPVVSFDDLDGDGRLDFLAGSGEEEVCAFLGVSATDGHRFQGKPSFCLVADPFLTFRFADLDGDGPAEILRFRSRDDGDRSVLTVTFLRR